MGGLPAAGWSDFGVAQVGASAALLGLGFVSVSINLRAIVEARELINRAAEVFFLLAMTLVTATFVLIPDQHRSALGAELVLVGLLVLTSVTLFQRGYRTAGVAPMVAVVFRRVCGLGAPVLVVVAGVSLIADGGGGLYWWSGAVVLAYFGALMGAWVLLVEVLR